MDHLKDHSLFGLGLPGYICFYFYVYTYVYIMYIDTCDSCERSCICIILIHICLEGHMNNI